MSRRMKLAAATAVIVLVVASACTRGGDDETTPAPTQPERVEVVSDFQLVGEVDEAFAGTEPDVDVPDPDDSNPAPETDDDVSGPTIAPDDTPFGSTPPVGGIMRITVEDASDPLTSECGVAADENVEVFWTTDTSFDPDDVLDDIEAIEDGIEGRLAGVSGRILRSGGGDDDDRDTPRPTVDVDRAETEAPDETDSFESEDLRSIESDTGDCVLVADQVGFESTALPTPSRTISRQPAPPAATEEPDDTAEPTPEPQNTEEPDEESPEPTATSTARQEPAR